MSSSASTHIDDFCLARVGCVTGTLFSEQAEAFQALTFENKNHGKALLLLHGFSSTPWVFRHIFADLTQQYDAILCPILPGHGQSIHAFSHTDRHAWLHFVESHVLSLLDTYASVDVMGLSLGGLLAFYIGQRIRVNHLYLLAPALYLKQNVSFNYYLATILRYLKFESIHNFAGNIHNISQSELTYRRVPLSAIIEIFKLIQGIHHQPLLSPADIFLGALDTVVDSKKVADFFAGFPQAQVHWLHQSAHILPLEAEASIITEHMRRNIAPTLANQVQHPHAP